MVDSPYVIEETRQVYRPAGGGKWSLTRHSAYYREAKRQILDIVGRRCSEGGRWYQIMSYGLPLPAYDALRYHVAEIDAERHGNIYEDDDYFAVEIWCKIVNRYARMLRSRDGREASHA